MKIIILLLGLFGLTIVKGQFDTFHLPTSLVDYNSRRRLRGSPIEQEVPPPPLGAVRGTYTYTGSDGGEVTVRFSADQVNNNGYSDNFGAPPGGNIYPKHRRKMARPEVRSFGENSEQEVVDLPVNLPSHTGLTRNPAIQDLENQFLPHPVFRQFQSSPPEVVPTLRSHHQPEPEVIVPKNEEIIEQIAQTAYENPGPVASSFLEELEHLIAKYKNNEHHQQLPLHQQPLPHHQQQLPHHQQQLPLHQQQFPLHQQQLPLHQQQLPHHQQQLPHHQQQLPLHQQQLPLHQQQLPHHQQQLPHHQQQQLPLHQQQQLSVHHQQQQLSPIPHQDTSHRSSRAKHGPPKPSFAPPQDPQASFSRTILSQRGFFTTLVE